MRRTAVGNFTGAAGILRRHAQDGGSLDAETLAACERRCVKRAQEGEPVRIARVAAFLTDGSWAASCGAPGGSRPA